MRHQTLATVLMLITGCLMLGGKDAEALRDTETACSMGLNSQDDCDALSKKIGGWLSHPPELHYTKGACSASLSNYGGNPPIISEEQDIRYAVRQIMIANYYQSLDRVKWLLYGSREGSRLRGGFLDAYSILEEGNFRFKEGKGYFVRTTFQFGELGNTEGLFVHMGPKIPGKTMHTVSAAGHRHGCGAVVMVTAEGKPAEPPYSLEITAHSNMEENRYHHRPRTIEEQKSVPYGHWVNLHPNFDHGYGQTRQLAQILMQKLLGVAVNIPSSEDQEAREEQKATDTVSQKVPDRRREHVPRCRQITDTVAEYDGQKFYPNCADSTTLSYYACVSKEGPPAQKMVSCDRPPLKSCQEYRGHSESAHCSELKSDAELEELLKLLRQPGPEGRRLIDDLDRLIRFLYDRIGTLEIDRIFSDEARQKMTGSEWNSVERAWRTLSNAINKTRALANEGKLGSIMDTLHETDRDLLSGTKHDFNQEMFNLMQERMRVREIYMDIFDKTSFDSDAWHIWQSRLMMDEYLRGSARRSDAIEEKVVDARRERMSRKMIAEGASRAKAQAMAEEWESRYQATQWASYIVPGMYSYNPYLREHVMNNPNASTFDKIDTFLGFGGQAGLWFLSGGTSSAYKSVRVAAYSAEALDWGLAVGGAVTADSWLEGGVNAASALLPFVQGTKFPKATKKRFAQIHETYLKDPHLRKIYLDDAFNMKPVSYDNTIWDGLVLPGRTGGVKMIERYEGFPGVPMGAPAGYLDTRTGKAFTAQKTSSTFTKGEFKAIDAGLTADSILEDKSEKSDVESRDVISDEEKALHEKAGEW
jgi:hypothetical protein